MSFSSSKSLNLGILPSQRPLLLAATLFILLTTLGYLVPISQLPRVRPPQTQLPPPLVPPPPPPKPKCDPYSIPGQLHLDRDNFAASHYSTYSPTCQPSESWIQKIIAAKDSNTTVPELHGKELVAIGDSVDRYMITDLCGLLGYPANFYPQHTYQEHTAESNGGHPRGCFVEHMNMTLVSWFFFGFDETSMWKDKIYTYCEPGNYSDRWSLFSDAIKTLPSGGTPDVVVASQGLWELARFDRQLQLSGLEADPDPPVLSDSFLLEFISNSQSFLRGLRTLVGDSTSLVWRQMHTPTTITGGSFKAANGQMEKNRERFHPLKIRMLNEAAREAVSRYNAEEEVRRWNMSRAALGDAQGDGVMKWWPVGDIVSRWPTEHWLRDDVHPSETVGATVWGNMMLEYLARSTQ